MHMQATAEAHTAPPILSMRSITKRFPGVIALDGVTFDVHPGEVHALVGENGAGKSTLMNIMSGVYTDFEGQIVLNGETVHFHNPRDAQKAGIVMIHQELNLVPELTVYENIFLGREHKSFGSIINRRSMRRTAQKLMFDLGLDIDPNRPINRMRVGQRQLVEIAKALNLNSRIIIMDEPTSALSDAEVEYLFSVIRNLRAHDVGVIYISHRLDEIFSIADRISVLRDGKVVGTSMAKDISRQELINSMVGRSLDVLYPKEAVELGDTILKVDHLSLRQGRTQVLDDISLEVRRGEIVGVAGLMGAGRTQLLETIFGVYPHGQASGTVWFDGQQRDIRTPKEAIELGIGLIAEDRKGQSLVLEQPVTENATLAALREFFYFLNIIDHRAERKAVTEIVDDLNIKTPSIRTMVANLSGGNQQKVVIAKFLLAKIKLFLLDEPTRGIDVGAKAEVYHLIGELAQQGTGFLLVSSELPELLAVCDRILVLCNGRLTGEFPRGSFDQAAIMEAATRFNDAENGPSQQQE
ncbi:sugar ABC transporter ATP-binding protein [Aggregatilinea sp.]